MKRTLWLLVALALVIPLDASTPTARPEEVGLSAERLKRVTELMQRHIDAKTFSGAVTLVARHGRQWGKEQVTFDPVHYLALLERKPGAFDSARPLAEWDLPERSPSCGGGSRRRGGGAGSGTTSRCCGCWRRQRSAT